MHQVQLDIYGAVVLAAHDFVVRGGELDRAEARLLRGICETVRKCWREPDNGIWEVRGGRRHHTYSKFMCWVALDRLIKLAEEGHLNIATLHFERTRAELRDAIETHGFNREIGSYVGVFGSDMLDVSLLLMARHGYLEPSDPRMVGTWQRIRRDLDRDGLLMRYSGDFDPMVAGEGAFGICSFWAVDYLVRLGEIDEGTRRFERLLACANDVGLFAEEIEIGTGGALGNFPQAYTHVGLLNAAMSLERAQGQRNR